MTLRPRFMGWHGPARIIHGERTGEQLTGTAPSLRVASQPQDAATAYTGNT